MNVRIPEVNGLALFAAVNRKGELGVQIAPSLKQAFRMAAADAVVCQSFRIQIAVASAQQARGFALYLIGQIIRLFRVPSDRSLFAYDADSEAELDRKSVV